MKLRESMTGFYYIGDDRANITKLVSMYKHGYASCNLEEVMAALSRENPLQPEVICCESSFGLAAVRQWARILSKQEDLSHIPFIIHADDLTSRENDLFVRHPSVDDLLNLKEWDENCLAAKIRFLQKFKKGHHEPERETLRVRLPKTLQGFLKRSFDVLVSFTALVFLAPVFLCIACAIRMESRGKIFYISQRAGRGYRIFDFYKFRTMFTGADQYRNKFAHLNQYRDSELVRFFKIENDPRITRVGKFLRNTSLDELPQLLNVLMGNMSLVGNRPLPLYEAETLTTDMLAKRFLAPAGITGLWQIKKRGQSIMSDLERINLDIDYADKSNLLYDMWIMARTPQALMQKANT
jgi:lipopolysaccharide/colanic/teichoic acid biosynthesis glycosyltransferase